MMTGIACIANMLWISEVMINEMHVQLYVCCLTELMYVFDDIELLLLIKCAIRYASTLWKFVIFISNRELDLIGRQ